MLTTFPFIKKFIKVYYLKPSFKSQPNPDTLSFFIMNNESLNLFKFSNKQSL